MLCRRYIVNIALNGSIPYAMVSMLATETPLCCARSRDIYYERAPSIPFREHSVFAIAGADMHSSPPRPDGYAPFVRLNPPTDEPSIVFQTESFSDPPANVDDEHAREYRCVITTGDKTGETFEIEYDTKRMYPGGVRVELEGQGVTIDDDGQGRVKVTTTDARKDVTVVITPK